MHANTGKRSPPSFSPSAALPLSLLLAFSGELITAERRHEYANRTRKDTRDCRGIFHDFRDFSTIPFSRYIRHIPDVHLDYVCFTLLRNISNVSIDHTEIGI